MRVVAANPVPGPHAALAVRSERQLALSAQHATCSRVSVTRFTPPALCASHWKDVIIVCELRHAYPAAGLLPAEVRRHAGRRPRIPFFGRRGAAEAPSDPSSQDRAVAAAAGSKANSILVQYSPTHRSLHEISWAASPYGTGQMEMEAQQQLFLEQASANGYTRSSAPAKGTF